MPFHSRLSVVVVGGGFCGIMTVVNLIRKAKDKKLQITLFNKKYPLAKGIAFCTYSDSHLLNVEARNMGAFPEEPEHFLNWCAQHKSLGKNREELSTSFLPRNLYGQYIEELFNSTISNLPTNINLEIIEEEVISIIKEKDTLTVKSALGKNITADKLILATGNSEPGPPSFNNSAFLNSKYYYSNPWVEKTVCGLSGEFPVLIVGTGLTMVDVVIGLLEKNFHGKIYALSPHGFKILSHKQLPPQPYILKELSPPYELEKLFNLFYKHIREAGKIGLPGETVVDAIRSRTQEIWQELSLSDKKKFMNHLRHLWGVARHRIPSHIHNEMEKLIKNNKLEVIAGRINNVTENGKSVDVEIKKRSELHSKEILRVERVINCTGPQSDINKQQSHLYSQLILNGIARADEMRLGIDATADGRIIDSKNNISNRIFAIGSLLKGKLWESTAVPELRKQASQVAELILNIDEISFA